MINIKVVATNVKYEKVSGHLTGNGAGKYTQLIDENNKIHGVFKDSVEAVDICTDCNFMKGEV
jgi:hypothetical protein